MGGRDVRTVRLVFPHQLFENHLDATEGTRFVLVEDDLLFRQYPFHSHKLVLHRASMRAFADRLREASYDVDLIESDGRSPSGKRLAARVEELRPQRVEVYDVVDDWLSRDVTRALRDAGHRLDADEVLETPNFLTTRYQIAELPPGRARRMQHFYSWQRQRLGILVEGPDNKEPVGGRWSFDTENRKKLPKGHVAPPVPQPDLSDHVRQAAEWVAEHFPDAPGDPSTFAWPITHAEAETGLDAFLDERFDLFGPYEDALSSDQQFLYHSLITPGLNIGLLDPRDVVRRALEVGSAEGVPIASLEGFVRQVIGWREYMRLTYVLHGRRMRTANHLGHDRPLAKGWWTAETGLEPVDLVLRRVLQRGWAHHIERLMVLGKAMCLLRTHPDAAYAWFMEMFVDSYDWVMVPNVYAMSQFAAGPHITTKPYVSGSNYLKKMSDFGPGEWRDDWDGLYWAFVRDHRGELEANPRARMAPQMLDRMKPATRKAHFERAEPWLTD